MAALTPQGLAMPHRAMGRFMHWLVRPSHAQAARTVAVWSLRPWRSLMEMWQEPHQQHDAAELLQFIAPLLVSDHDRLHVCWQARELCDRHSPPSSQAPAQVIDQGTLWPMTVAARLASPLHSAEAHAEHTRPISLQSLIIQWWNQASRHALSAAPAWLVLQVSRFDDSGRKLVAPVSISDAVYIPYFTGKSLTTSSGASRSVPFRAVNAYRALQGSTLP